MIAGVAGASLAACGGGLDARLADEPNGFLVSSGPSATAVATEPADAGVRLAADRVEVTRAPWPVGDLDGAPARDRELARACGVPDAALERTARRVAEARAKGLGTPDADRVAMLLRASGAPHLRPRVLAATGRSPLEESTLRGRLEELRGERSACGVSSARTPHGGEVVVAVAVDALADLSPLATHAAPGEWLTFDAKVRVPFTAPVLLVTGERGRPRTVPLTHDPENGTVRARFALDRPGAFTLQLVADTEGGPRPLLEARIVAGSADEAETDGDAAPAPGEDASTDDDVDGLTAMIQALRDGEGLAPLARSTRLDALARAHATKMRDQHAVAHDLGEGDLRLRFEAEGLAARTVGENVAHAVSLARAHRVLHQSPSHRRNLLEASYTHLGLGEARAEDGTVYVCEIFATDLRGHESPRAAAKPSPARR